VYKKASQKMDPDKLTHRTNEALTASQDLAMGLDMHRSHLSHGQSKLYGQQVKAKMEQQVKAMTVYKIGSRMICFLK
ncbi:hypothetical protein Tco_0114277, partial [Tanacetum coccineum]